MAIFTIPKYKLKELEKKIDKIRRKGAVVSFEIINDNVMHRYRDAGTPTVFSIPCYEIFVNGHYVINGWSFVGTIEHSSPENIIRIADSAFDGRIPERYRTASRDCEHCHIRRDRTDTYLIYNEDEDEWKQVGRTCLKNYTQGLDAEVCASMIDVFAEIAKASQNAEIGSFDIDFRSPAHVEQIGLERDRIRKQVLQYIKDNGYLPVRTVNDFKDKLIKKEQLREATNEEVQEITAAAKRLGNSDWSRNARAAWNKEYIEMRDLALIASLCSICLENITKENARRDNLEAPSNVFAGEIGDMVEFTVASSMISHYRTPNVYGAASYPVYRMTDDEGKVYAWGCTNKDIVIEPGKHIKGRIKSTFERKNGEKVTELTRCKVL